VEERADVKKGNIRAGQNEPQLLIVVYGMGSNVSRRYQRKKKREIVVSTIGPSSGWHTNNPYHHKTKERNGNFMLEERKEVVLFKGK